MHTMTKSGLPRSTRKFIRLEKARIRAEFFDVKKQEEKITELYNSFLAKPVAVEKFLEKKPARIATQSVTGGDTKKATANVGVPQDAVKEPKVASKKKKAKTK